MKTLKLSGKSKVIPLHSPTRPKTFTSQEALIEAVREEIFTSRKLYRIIAHECNVSPSTVANLASGKTRWPRPTTLFPLIHYLGFDLALVRR